MVPLVSHILALAYFKCLILDGPHSNFTHLSHSSPRLACISDLRYSK